MTMRLTTRSFLYCFVPFVLLLVASFWAMQHSVVGTVRQGLRDSLHEKQVSLARLYAKSELQSSRFLRVVGENAALKAGLQLVLGDPGELEARRTVEDQLRELCETLGFDFLLVSSPTGQPLAGVIRDGRHISPMDVEALRPPARGFFTTAGRTYQISSVPIDQGEENIGALTVGEYFDFADFDTPAVLTRNGHVIKSNLEGFTHGAIEAALASCRPDRECEILLNQQTFVSSPMDRISFGDGYVLRSLQNVDAASAPVQAVVQHVFLITAIAAVLACLALSAFSSSTIVRPIRSLVSHLKTSEESGEFAEFKTGQTAIREIRELMESFNRSVAAIRQGQQNLHRAYVEFVGSLANALDARDPYTAGHSRRVSEYACAIARAIELPADEMEQLRIGSLLHDIGKIGIADQVLQKPGRLTPEEFAAIREHPSIGRRILEGVRGFQPYLATVELHHENWDGSGYPGGLAQEATPLEARIVHVADAYDAMTSDRPYRRGMSHEQALKVLQENAGTQFDPAIVSIFVELDEVVRNARAEAHLHANSVERLAAAVNLATSDAPARGLTKQ